MRKLIALLLVILQISVMCACGNTDEPASTEPASTEPAVEETGILSEIDKEKEFSQGVTEGQTYKSEFVGIGCELDSDWLFYDEEKIAELNKTAMEMAGEDYKNAVSNIEVVYDMFAVDSTGLNNVSVTLEKGDISEIEKVNLTEYYENVISSAKANFTSMGCTNISCEVVTLNIDNKPVQLIKTKAEANGTMMNQTYFSKKCNGYMANVTTTTFGEDKCEEILAKFYWL